MGAITITKENFQAEVIKSEQVVLLDFWASWCSPCRMLSPIVDEVAKEMPNIKVCKINVDEESFLATKFGVASIPMLLVMKNGQIKNKSLGLISKEAVKKLLQ